MRVEGPIDGPRRASEDEMKTIMTVLGLLFGGSLVGEAAPTHPTEAREVGEGERRTPTTDPERTPKEKPRTTEREAPKAERRSTEPTTERTERTEEPEPSRRSTDDCDCDRCGHDSAREEKKAKREHPHGRARRGRAFGHEVREIMKSGKRDEALADAIGEAARRRAADRD